MPGQALIAIKDKEWSVSVATTPVELSQGLGGLASIPAESGMLFDLGGDRVVSVTSVPMLFNLDIVFISSSLQVVDIAQNVAPGQILTENTPVRYFMEVNGGETQGIAVGDGVSIQGYTPLVTTTQTTSITDMITAFMPLLMMFGFMMLMRIVTTKMFPPAKPKLPPGYAPVKAPPAKPTAEEELEEKKRSCENTGREIARLAGVEFVRLDKGWEPKYATPRYWFKDARGNEIIATDLEELKGKLAIITRHHSSPGKEYWYLGEWWEEEYSTAECVVYRSKDGKKRLYVYWDGTHEVKPAPELPRFTKGQIITIKPEARHIYLGRTTATVQADDPKYNQVWTKEIPSAVAYRDVVEWRVEGGGTCYEDAWRFLLKQEEGELVHGSVESDGKRINHAWVELPTGYIYEPEHKEFFTKEKFKQIAKPEEHNRYTAEQVAIMAARTKTFGPWTEDERKAFLKGEHHSMWLTPEQRKPLEEKYGAVAVRWAEEATRPGDIKAAERAAEYYNKKLREALGLGHLSPELTEEQIMKLREVLGLDRDVAKVLKIHRETGYIP